MSDEVDVAVGRAIGSYRATKQWTQSQLAEAVRAKGLSIAQQTVAKIESGTRPLKVSEAVTFASALGVQVADLLIVNNNRTSRLTIEYWHGELDAAKPAVEASLLRYAKARISAATVVVWAEDTDFETMPITISLQDKATELFDCDLVDIEAQLISEIEDKYERKTVERMFGVL